MDSLNAKEWMLRPLDAILIRDGMVFEAQGQDGLYIAVLRDPEVPLKRDPVFFDRVMPDSVRGLGFAGTLHDAIVIAEMDYLKRIPETNQQYYPTHTHIHDDDFADSLEKWAWLGNGLYGRADGQAVVLSAITGTALGRMKHGHMEAESMANSFPLAYRNLSHKISEHSILDVRVKNGILHEAERSA